MSTARKAAYKIRRRSHEGGLLHRLMTILMMHHAWYDWGHRLMAIVGRWDGAGDYGAPRGRDLWYYAVGRGKFVTTHDFADVRANRSQEWKILDVQDDGGTVMLGYYPEGNGHITFYGLDRHELKLFRRWDFWECRARGEWFGLRRTLYYAALHAAVHLKKPFACNLTPPRGTGGYSHWHCELRGKHTVHRFRNYTWDEAQPRVTYDPQPVAR